MKIKFRFIKRIHPCNYYYPEKSTDYIIQKRGWFGWKTLNEVYDGVWSYHLSWSYFCTPGRNNFYDTFKSKGECLLFLKTYYNKLVTVLE